MPAGCLIMAGADRESGSSDVVVLGCQLEKSRIYIQHQLLGLYSILILPFSTRTYLLLQ